MKTASCYKIIILDDFSIHIEKSFRFINFLNPQLKPEIILLHIIDKEQEAQMEKENISLDVILNKIKERALFFKEKYQLSVSFKIELGTIFETVPLIAKNEQISLIVLNTPGLTKFQQYVGSNAFRLIKNSPVPIIVIPENCKDSFKNIITNHENYPDTLRQLLDNKLNITMMNLTSCLNELSIILCYISKTAFENKQEQKNIENLIFNEQHLPIICWKN